MGSVRDRIVVELPAVLVGLRTAKGRGVGPTLRVQLHVPCIRLYQIVSNP